MPFGNTLKFPRTFKVNIKIKLFLKAPIFSYLFNFAQYLAYLAISDLSIQSDKTS